MSMTFFVVTETDMKGGVGEEVGVACYIRNDSNYNVQSYFPKEIENILILFELLLPNTKPIVVGTIYRPPN